MLTILYARSTLVKGKEPFHYTELPRGSRNAMGKLMQQLSTEKSFGEKRWQDVKFARFCGVTGDVISTQS